MRLAVLGMVLAGSVAGAQPASAGYACGPWNGWCSYYSSIPVGTRAGTAMTRANNNWNKHGYKNVGQRLEPP